MKLFKKALYKIFRKKLVKDFNKFCKKKDGQVLVYYKTDPIIFRSVKNDFFHTNNWEIFQMVKIFNELGYWVDILDRTATPNDFQTLEDKYDIFLGIGAGDSGRYFGEIAEKLPKAIKILYAMGPEPVLSDQLIETRYQYFERRHPGLNLERRRFIKNVDVDRVIKNTDVIFINGNSFTRGSYAGFGKAIYRVFSSSHPGLSFDQDSLKESGQKKFLYFGGNGNIVKGLDLVIEAFSELPDLELYIGAPDYEEEFNNVYLPMIKNLKNIHFLGFIDVDGPVFNEVTSKCGYVILPSCSEGCATSVTTCMRRGLIPIVTYETGLDVDGFGCLIKEIEIDKLRKQIVDIVREPREEFLNKRKETYRESFKYTQDGFSRTFKESVQKVLLDFKKNK